MHSQAVPGMGMLPQAVRCRGSFVDVVGKQMKCVDKDRKNDII